MSTPPRPLTVEAFDLLWEHVSTCHENATMNNRMRQMASAFSFLLDQATLWVWHTDTDVFPAMSIQTSQGLRWGLPSGQVVSTESEVLDTMQTYLGTDNIKCVPGKSIEAFRRHLPEALSEGHWNKLGFGHFGVGMLLEATIPVDQLDEEALMYILARFSCHPHFGRRIINDLIQNGERLTTVMSVFASRLPEVAVALATMGVRVSRTWPKPGAGHPELPPGVERSFGKYLPKHLRAS